MAKSNRYVVFTIVERPGAEKAIWRRVGGGTRNRDGSITVVLDALPVNGSLHIREVGAEEVPFLEVEKP